MISSHLIRLFSMSNTNITHEKSERQLQQLDHTYMLRHAKISELDNPVGVHKNIGPFYIPGKLACVCLSMILNPFAQTSNTHSSMTFPNQIELRIGDQIIYFGQRRACGEGTCGQYSDCASRLGLIEFGECSCELLALWMHHTLEVVYGLNLQRHTLNIYTTCPPTANLQNNRNMTRPYGQHFTSYITKLGCR